MLDFYEIPKGSSMVFAVIVPIFLLLLSGYFSVKIDLLKKDQIQVLSLFVVKIALPALLFHALSSKNFQDIWFPSYFAVYAGVTFFLYAIGVYIFRKFYRESFTDASVLAMGGAMSNTGFIGTAILTLLIGASQATTYISMILIIESVMLVPTVLALAEAGLQKQAKLSDLIKNTIFTLLKNPIFLSVVLGMLCAMLQLHIPKNIDQVFMLLGQTASPLALFVIGAGLVGLSIQYVNVQSILLVFLKNILMPLLVFLGLSYLTNVGQEMVYAGTIIAALPMPTLFGILGQIYGLNEKSLTPLVISTVFGFVVISGLIAYWW